MESELCSLVGNKIILQLVLLIVEIIAMKISTQQLWWSQENWNFPFYFVKSGNGRWVDELSRWRGYLQRSQAVVGTLEKLEKDPGPLHQWQQTVKPIWAPLSKKTSFKGCERF